VPRYILSPESKDDLREIRDYLVSQGGRRLARYVLQEITAAFRLLASHPEAGHFRTDLTPLPVKFWPVFSYLIVYDPAARPLAIVRVLHGRQDLGRSSTQRRSSRPSASKFACSRGRHLQSKAQAADDGAAVAFLRQIARVDCRCVAGAV
jgi:antitoxin ParD1/3/4/toxin ParE1/3/4